MGDKYLWIWMGATNFGCGKVPILVLGYVVKIAATIETHRLSTFVVSLIHTAYSLNSTFEQL